MSAASSSTWPTRRPVRDAFERIRDNVAKVGEADAFEGVTVQPMVTDKGIELIVGSSVDRQFGPVVLFGAGGVLVEVLQGPGPRPAAAQPHAGPPAHGADADLPGAAGRARPEAGGPGGAGDAARRASASCWRTSSRIQEVDMNPVLAGAGPGRRAGRPRAAVAGRPAAGPAAAPGHPPVSEPVHGAVPAARRHGGRRCGPSVPRTSR